MGGAEHIGGALKCKFAQEKRREEERRGEEDEGFKAGEIRVFGGELIETVVSVVCIFQGHFWLP